MKMSTTEARMPYILGLTAKVSPIEPPRCRGGRAVASLSVRDAGARAIGSWRMGSRPTVTKWAQVKVAAMTPRYTNGAAT